MNHPQLTIRFTHRQWIICHQMPLPADVVWRTIIDTSQWPVWGPSVAEIDCPDRYITAGSRGRVKTVLGLWLPFFICDYQQSRSWSWRVGHLRATGHTVEPRGDERCLLCFSMPWWAPFYLPVCHLAIKAVGRQHTKKQYITP
jgi:hypothetical protein